MTQRVTFSALWLASEKDRRARMIDLSHPKILLLGPNGTGKSRITKNIFWAFGCEPRKRNAGAWDPDTIAALDFELDGQKFTTVRSGRLLGMFDGRSRPLHLTSNLSAWMEYCADLFHYPLTLQRPKANAYRPAGLTYLTLPYYIDQDGSWGPTWTTYSDLGQFASWQGPVFDAFTGLRPTAYLRAKQRRDEIRVIITEKQREVDAQRSAFKRVRNELPKNIPSLDLTRFRAELTELAVASRKVQTDQVEARAKLVAVVSQGQQLLAELQLASGAHRELVADLSYLSDIPDGSHIECPTCGTKHTTSFHARLELAKDSDSMSALVVELNKRLEKNREEEMGFRRELREVEKSLSSLDQLVEERKARLKLDDVLAAHSKKTIDKAFTRVTSKLHEDLESLQSKYDALTETVKLYEDRERSARVREYYASQLRHLSDRLHIPSDERVDETKIGARPNSGGSSGPRAVLAVHLAMLAANVEYGDTARFPFVVDTPQQSGQDESNLKGMIVAIKDYAGSEHPVILAVERLPENTDISDFQVTRLEEKQRLLRESEFEQVADRLRSMVRTLKDANASGDAEQGSAAG